MKIFGANNLPLAVTAFAVAATLACGATRADTSGSSANVFFGQKSLSSSDWSPLENQSEWGLNLVLGRTEYPVALLVGYFKSEDSGDVYGYNTKAETTELLLGARKSFTTSASAIPYLEAGLANVDAKITVLGVGLSDSATGFWFGAGVEIPVGERVRVGLELRISNADMDIAGAGANAGGTHFGVTAGVGF